MTTPKKRVSWRSISPETPVVFQGRTYTSRGDLAADFPAFSGEDVVRALIDGCTTVLEVEAHAFRRRQIAYRAARDAARRTQAKQARQGGKARQRAKARGARR